MILGAFTLFSKMLMGLHEFRLIFIRFAVKNERAHIRDTSTVTRKGVRKVHRAGVRTMATEGGKETMADSGPR